MSQERESPRTTRRTAEGMRWPTQVTDSRPDGTDPGGRSMPAATPAFAALLRAEIVLFVSANRGRLTQELESVTRTSREHLLIALTLMLGGCLAIAFTSVPIEPETSTRLMTTILQRSSLLVFIGLPLAFFLRCYAAALRLRRYYQNEVTQLQYHALALQMTHMSASGSERTIDAILQSADRNRHTAEIESRMTRVHRAMFFRALREARRTLRTANPAMHLRREGASERSGSRDT